MAEVVVCGVIHESNAFAGDVTPIDAFIRLDGERFGRAVARGGTEMAGAVDGLTAHGATPIPTTLAWAQSSGPVDDDAVHVLIGELLDGIDEPTSVDGVVICLHGSMCSTSDPDVDGTILAALRAHVGPATPIVATLDWHSSATDRMVAAADALVGYRTYPHIDQVERGSDAAALVVRMIEDQPSVHASHRHPPMLVAGPQTRHDAPAMAAILSLAGELAADERILTWSVLPGFACSDNPSTGAHVYALATEAAVADEFTARIAAELWDTRHAFLPDTAPPTATLLDHIGDDGPLVLSDQGDNPGGGAAGDGTSLLGLLQEHGPPGSIVAALHDPAAVAACVDAGVGATVDLVVGGHTDERHGDPLALRATVGAIADGRYTMQSPTHPGVRVQVGDVARVRTDRGVEVVLTSTRVQNEDLELLAHVGLEPTSAPVIAVKSNAHFRAAYEPIAGCVIDVDTPGLSTPHLERLPYAAVPRPIFPLDLDMTWSPNP